MLRNQILVLILLGHHLTAVEVSDKSLSNSIASILLKHYSHFYEAVHLLQANSNENSFFRQRDLVDRVLVNLRGRLSVCLDNVSDAEPHLYHVIFTDGYEALNSLLSQSDVRRFDPSGYYLIVISEDDPADEIVKQVLTYSWDLRLINLNVILRQDGHVLVFVYHPFQEGQCRRIRPRLLSNLTSSGWNSSSTLEFYWNRLRNFHGCALLGGTFEAKPYTIYRDVQPGGSFQVSGFEGDLMKVLADRLNFTLQWKNSPGQWGFARPLGNSTGLMKMAQEDEVDFAIGCLAMDPDRYRYLMAGISHYTSKILFAVPHGRPYTAFEKLFGPFQKSVLEMEAFFIIVTFLVTLVLNFASRNVRVFVYGRGVSTPFLNALAILFGGSIPRLPARNFARTLLLLWLIFCFIIDSLYQGSLYRCLQKPLQYPPLRTMDEIDRSGLWYYMVDIGTRFFANNPNIMRRTIIIPAGKDSLGQQVTRLGQGLTDGVVLSPMDLVAYNNRVNPRSRFVNIAREHVSVFPVGLYYPRRTLLRAVIDEQVRMIVPSGLVNDWVKRYGDYDFFARPKEKSHPKPLSIGHLAGCFQLYGCLIGASLGLFLLEMVAPRFAALQVTLRRLIDP